MRYVVLHHTGWQQDHFDLLLETSADGLLASYRFSAWPPGLDAQVEINAPHRRLYLHYEGPISDNRGKVVRVEAGHYERISEVGPEKIVLLSSGIRLALPESQTC